VREATYTINGITLGSSPYLITEPPKGFNDGPPIRTASIPRPHQHGAYGDAGWAGAKLLELEGMIVLPGTPDTWAAMNDAIGALIGGCWASDQTVLRITGSGVDRIMSVRSTGSGVEAVESNVHTGADWHVMWEALDPREYSFALHSLVTTLPGSIGGVGFDMAAPINFGGGTTGGTLSAPNAGTAPAPWVARFDGPLTAPIIEHVEQGRSLQLNTTIAAGDFYVLDSAAHSVLLAGTASRYNLLARPTWFDLTPGANTIRLGGAAGAGTLTFTYRDAWW
jgi:hypothetical protein